MFLDNKNNNLLPRTWIIIGFHYQQIDNESTANPWTNVNWFPSVHWVWPHIYKIHKVNLHSTACLMNGHNFFPHKHKLIAIWLHCDANRGIKHEICGKYGFSKSLYNVLGKLMSWLWIDGLKKVEIARKMRKIAHLPETPSVELVCGWLLFFFGQRW